MSAWRLGRSVQARNGFIKLARQIVERLGQAFTPPDQHIVMAGDQPVRTGPHRFTQPALYAAAFRRVTGLLGHGISHTGNRIGNRYGLQHKAAPGNFTAPRGFKKLRPFFQASYRQCRVIRHIGTEPDLCRKPLAPDRATAIENLAAVLGRHAGTETVTAGAHKIARLESTLHYGSSRAGPRDPLVKLVCCL